MILLLGHVHSMGMGMCIAMGMDVGIIVMPFLYHYFCQ